MYLSIVCFNRPFDCVTLATNHVTCHLLLTFNLQTVCTQIRTDIGPDLDKPFDTLIVFLRLIF